MTRYGAIRLGDSHSGYDTTDIGGVATEADRGNGRTGRAACGARGRRGRAR